MAVTDDQITLSDGVIIPLKAVKSLKMLNEKLLFEMNDRSLLEISGLSHKELDRVFAAYSRHLSSR